jgi:hypothetical protein
VNIITAKCHRCGREFQREHFGAPRRTARLSCPACKAETEAKNAKNYRVRKKLKSTPYYYTRGVAPRPCAICGSTDGIDKHHFDYQRPTVVVFLCRSCHRKLHDGEVDVDSERETRKNETVMQERARAAASGEASLVASLPRGAGGANLPAPQSPLARPARKPDTLACHHPGRPAAAAGG